MGHTPSPFKLFDHFSFRQLSGIMSGYPFFLVALRHHAQIPYLFGGSLASCSNPLYFWWLSDIVPKSPIFSMTFRHCARILYHFGGSSASCPDLFSCRQLSSIVSRSLFFFTALQHGVLIPIFFVAFLHHVQIIFLFSGSLASCPDSLLFRRLSDIVSRSLFFSKVL